MFDGSKYASGPGRNTWQWTLVSSQLDQRINIFPKGNKNISIYFR